MNNNRKAASSNTGVNGLTAVILEALLNMTPEVVASGEVWSPELLDEVRHSVRGALAPDNGRGRQIIFNLVFERAFKEASEMLLASAGLTRKGGGYPATGVNSGCIA